MAIVNVFGNKMILVTKPVGWSFKGFYLKRYPSGLKEGIGRQKEIRAAFARAAIETFGHKGKATYKGVSMPRPAVEIAARMAGKGSPEETKRRREEAARARHEAAVARWGGVATPI